MRTKYSGFTVVHTKLPPSPVILWRELGGTPKWLPLHNEYHDVMHTAPCSKTVAFGMTELTIYELYEPMKISWIAADLYVILHLSLSVIHQGIGVKGWSARSQVRQDALTLYNIKMTIARRTTPPRAEPMITQMLRLSLVLGSGKKKSVLPCRSKGEIKKLSLERYQYLCERSRLNPGRLRGHIFCLAIPHAFLSDNKFVGFRKKMNYRHSPNKTNFLQNNGRQ